VKRFLKVLLFVFLSLVCGIFFSPHYFLPPLARVLIVNELPTKADAAVVLNTDLEIYPRLMAAAELYGRNQVRKVIINGNRKSSVLKDLEKAGYSSCCPWQEERVRILELLGVPRQDIISISLEDAYDTVSEAKGVGAKLITNDEISSIIISTSKTHTRRARYIWEQLFGDKLIISSQAAPKDPFDPSRWWREGRQIRWVLYEYGSWIFYYWKQIAPDASQRQTVDI